MENENKINDVVNCFNNRLANYILKIDDGDFLKVHFALFKLDLDLKGLEMLIVSYFLNTWRISRENGWIDTENNIYFLANREKLAMLFNSTRQTMTKVIKNLESKNIIQVKRNKGQANAYYFTINFFEKLIKLIELEKELKNTKKTQD